MKITQLMQIVIRNLYRSLLFYIYFCLVYTVFRLVFYFALLHEPSHQLSAIFHSFVLGVGFDTKFIAIVSLLFTLVAWCSPLFRTRAEAIQRKLILSMSYVFMFLSVFLFIVDYYFYSNFGKRMDIEVFRIFEDETQMLLDSIYSDYNITGIILTILVTLVAHHFIFRKLLSLNLPKPSQLKFQIAFMILYVLLIAHGARGSFGKFPLRRDDMFISQSTALNANVSNPVFSLKEAHKNKRKFSIRVSKSSIMERYNLSESEFENLNADSTFYTYTPKNQWLEQNKPNVVFVLMESMSMFLLQQHAPNNDMMGSLADVIDSCVVFENFVSATGGTIESLEQLQVSTLNKHIARTRFKDKQFKTSIALPFKHQGYSTNYVSSGKLGWRNTGPFFKKQGYTNLYGHHHIHASYTDVEANAWGTHDEYLYRVMYDKLQESQQQQTPFFGFGLTVSNHTPFSLPSHYTLKPLELTPEILQHSHADREQLLKSLQTFQYANHSLGEFMKKIIYSDLGKNTIIVATGDHTSRKVKKFTDDEVLSKVAVPLIMYIPPQYRPKQIDTARFGSHKDIFPTLFNLALSNAKYAKLGNNLLGASYQDFFALYDGLTFFDNTPLSMIKTQDSLTQLQQGILEKQMLRYEIALFKNTHEE